MGVIVNRIPGAQVTCMIDDELYNYQSSAK